MITKAFKGRLCCYSMWGVAVKKGAIESLVLCADAKTKNDLIEACKKDGLEVRVLSCPVVIS